jgi:hypothetical protein
MIDLSNIFSSNHHTSISLIVFASVLTLILSLLLVLIYDKTSRQVSRPDHFIQSLLLMSLVTCTIMQSIGDSLALSFGIFGALAIIRFRTRISDPRDVAFVFASMAIGIACGVHSFLNGIIGTLAFCFVVIVIRFSHFGQKNNLIGSLRVLILSGDESFKLLKTVLSKYSHDFSLKRMRLNVVDEEVEKTEYEFKLVLKEDKNINDLVASLYDVNSLKMVRFVFEDQNDVDPI